MIKVTKNTRAMRRAQRFHELYKGSLHKLLNEKIKCWTRIGHITGTYIK